MLPFDQRACFIAGQAKSGTTLVAALLDNHPELLVLPQETAYFPTVLKKYSDADRRRQFDYLTKESFSRVLFGGEPKWREHEYGNFPQQKFRETFERVAFDSANTNRDLLALMAESYAATIGDRCPSRPFSLSTCRNLYVRSLTRPLRIFSSDPLRSFEDRIVAQDIPIVESQRPELLPLDLQAELHLRCDRTAVAYRKYLKELGVTFGTA